MNLTLSVIDGPYITVQELGLKIVKENDTNVIIPCKGKSYPTPAVVWKKNGIRIHSPRNLSVASNNTVYQIITRSEFDNKSNVHLEVTSTLFLRTNGLKHEDHGNYTCEVLNFNESSVPLIKTVEIQCKYTNWDTKSYHIIVIFSTHPPKQIEVNSTTMRHKPNVD